MFSSLFAFPVLSRANYLLACVLLALATTSQAGLLRERLQERQQARQQAAESPSNTATGINADLFELGGDDAQDCRTWARKVARLERIASRLHPGPTPSLSDVAYGSAPLEKLDVYLPSGKPGSTASSASAGSSTSSPNSSAATAPILLMVHGGGWCVGDKAAAGITANKVAHWVSKGFIFVSINYPMVAEGSDALAQAGHVARALAYVQQHAAPWGGDSRRIVLMGHSAGAHLVSLVNASARLRAANGAGDVLGTVSLDAGAIDVVRQMPQVYPFLKTRYHEAFGNAEAGWIAASPYHQLDARAAPWLGVCSTQRQDDPCGQAQAYAAKSKGLGIPAAVQPENLGHGAINKELGQHGAYTAAVDAFLAGLDPQLARLLKEAK